MPSLQIGVYFPRNSVSPLGLAVLQVLDSDTWLAVTVLDRAARNSPTALVEAVAPPSLPEVTPSDNPSFLS